MICGSEDALDSLCPVCPSVMGGISKGLQSELNQTFIYLFTSAPTGAWGDGKGSPSGSACICSGGRVEGQSKLGR
jgi:hypothetical protein